MLYVLLYVLINLGIFVIMLPTAKKEQREIFLDETKGMPFLLLAVVSFATIPGIIVITIDNLRSK